jgi:hypothetical protein
MLGGAPGPGDPAATLRHADQAPSMGQADKMLAPLRRAGLKPAQDAAERIHDLRHAFVV